MGIFGTTESDLYKWRSNQRYDKIRNTLSSSKPNLAKTAFTILIEDKPDEIREQLLNDLTLIPKELHAEATQLMISGSLKNRETEAKFCEILGNTTHQHYPHVVSALKNLWRTLSADLFSKSLKNLLKSAPETVEELVILSITNMQLKEHRTIALKMLLSLRDSESAQRTIMSLLYDEIPDDQVIGVVGSSAPKELRNQLFLLLKDSSPELQKKTIELMSRFHWNEAKEQLLHLSIEQTDELVRAAAAKALQELGGIEKKQWIKYLSHQSPKIQEQAKKQLMLQLDSEVIEQLLSERSFNQATVISMITHQLVHIKQVEHLIADIVSGLFKGTPGYEELLKRICSLSSAQNWLVSEPVLNAVFSLSSEERAELARLLIRQHQDAAVHFYYQELDGSLPPEDVLRGKQ